MTGKRKILLTVLSLLLVCNLAFIWGNSLVSRSDSHDLSVGVLGFLPGFIRDLFPNQEQLVHIVRKMAHFTEFACLGGLSCGLDADGSCSPFTTCGREAFLWLPSMKPSKSLRAGAPSSRTCGWISPGFSAGLLAVLLLRAPFAGPSRSVQSTAPGGTPHHSHRCFDAFFHLFSSSESPS